MTPAPAGHDNLDGVAVTPLDPQLATEQTATGTVVVLTARGRLDGDSGAALARVATAAAADAAVRIDVDLSTITGFTPEGARWLQRCRRLSDELPEGLHYRTGRGPGRDALLAAYAEES